MPPPVSIQAKILKSLPLTASVHQLTLQPLSELPAFKAGQFLMVHLDKTDAVIKKAYSIASPPSQKDRLELCVKRVEDGFASNTLCSLGERDTLTLSLPYGVFTLKETDRPNLVFAATGTGIAPLRSMIHSLFETPCTKNIWLIFGNRSEEEILYHSEWIELEEQYPDRFRYIPTISKGKNWTGETLYVQHVIRRLFSGKAGTIEFYGCGIIPMCHQLKLALLEMNIPREHMHFEQFT